MGDFSSADSDVGGDVDRLDLAQMDDAVPLRPGGEPTCGPGVGVEGVRVPDMGGEELSMTRRSASGSGASSAGSRPSSIRSTGSAVAELRIASRPSEGSAPISGKSYNAGSLPYVE